MRFKTGIYINPHSGYCYFSTAKNRKKLVHRVVWEEKFGKIPMGYEIHHKDRNKQNNTIENLELIKHKEHFNNYHPEITFEKATEANIKSRIKRQNEVKQLFMLGKSVEDIINLFGYSRFTISRYLRAH